jgi:regulator of replication initiation timing
VNEKEIEITKEELFEMVKRLSNEVSELRFELKETKQEIKRLRKWIGQVSEFAIKKSVRSL